jgi:hypothetical protein
MCCNKECRFLHLFHYQRFTEYPAAAKMKLMPLLLPPTSRQEAMARIAEGEGRWQIAGRMKLEEKLKIQPLHAHPSRKGEPVGPGIRVMILAEV